MTRRVLFVCEGNLHRSPTAERFCADRPGIEARSAGLSSLARVQVCEELLEWAEVVVCLDRQIVRKLRRGPFAALLAGREVVCLDIPDEYQADQAELVALLAERLTPHFDRLTEGTPPS